MKFLNTSGMVDQAEHYKLDHLAHRDMDEMLIAQKKYFTLHSLRQTGKPSCLPALRGYLNKEGDYHCVYADFEMGQTVINNVESGMKTLLTDLNKRCRIGFGIDLGVSIPELVADGADRSINTYLAQLCATLDKPLRQNRLERTELP